MRILRLFSSLDLSLWLLCGVMILLAAGSFTITETSGINDVALFSWLREAPLSVSWWLWGSVALLVLLALNTILCSVADFRERLGGGILKALAPHLIHAGFLLVVAAHLASSWGGVKDGGMVRQGTAVTLPDGSTLRFDRIDVQTGPFGMATDYAASVTHLTSLGMRQGVTSPNHPFFAGPYGIYLKHAEGGPMPAAIVEMHREPGAPLALAGAILFTLGNLLVLFIRRGGRVRDP